MRHSGLVQPPKCAHKLAAPLNLNAPFCNVDGEAPLNHNPLFSHHSVVSSHKNRGVLDTAEPIALGPTQSGEHMFFAT